MRNRCSEAKGVWAHESGRGWPTSEFTSYLRLALESLTFWVTCLPALQSDRKSDSTKTGVVISHFAASALEDVTDIVPSQTSQCPEIWTLSPLVLVDFQQVMWSHVKSAVQFACALGSGFTFSADCVFSVYAKYVQIQLCPVSRINWGHCSKHSSLGAGNWEVLIS